MKTCIKCKVPKLIEEYYIHSQMADGRLGKCKQCCRDDANQRRTDKIEEIRAYDRSRNNLPHRVEARKLYAEGKPEALKRAKRNWELRNPEKAKASEAVNNAVRDGRLFKKPCEVCGSQKVEGHHDDYTKILEVRWLCKKHHMKADKIRQQKEALTASQGL